MRILMVTMFGFNEAFKFSHQDQTAFGLAKLRHEVFGYAYLDEQSRFNSRRAEEKQGVKIRRFLPSRSITSSSLRRALKEDGPFDLIHLHHLRNTFSYEVTRYSLKENVPLIFEPHGLLHDPCLVENRDFPFSGPIKLDELILTKKTLLKKIFICGRLRGYLKNYGQHLPLTKAQVLLALSSHERDLLERLTNRSDIEILPHWVDRESLGKAVSSPVRNELARPLILFVGQLKYRRGFDLAIKIFSRLRKKNPSATLLVVTNNSDKKKEFFTLAKREGITESLILKENISEEEKFALYRQADIYLSPTRYEGFGVTFLEAMACGCPIVASNIPVVREIVEDGRTGLLARLEDPFDFYRKITRLLGHRDLREDIIRQGLLKVEQEYDKEKIFSRLLKIYERVKR